MNTGYVGGDAKYEERGDALKVKIPHSSAMPEAMLSEAIKWKRAPDFGYEIPDTDAPQDGELLAKVPQEILNPKLFDEKKGRLSEYTDWVQRIKRERREFPEKYKVNPRIIKAVVG